MLRTINKYIMKAKYDRKEIFKNAWTHFKNGFTFSEGLTMAWSEHKSSIVKKYKHRLLACRNAKQIREYKEIIASVKLSAVKPLYSAGANVKYSAEEKELITKHY